MSKVIVEVFATHACPHCASAMKVAAEAVAALGEGEFDLRLVDVVQELDHAVMTGVLRVPAIAINGGLAFTGVPAAHALRRVLGEATAFASEQSSAAPCLNIASAK